NKPKAVSRLVARLTNLGYYVDLKPLEPELLNTDATPEPIIEEPPIHTAEPDQPHNTAVAPKRKKGRPCKCAERGIICTHQASIQVNSLIRNTSSTGTFS